MNLYMVSEKNWPKKQYPLEIAPLNCYCHNSKTTVCLAEIFRTIVSMAIAGDWGVNREKAKGFECARTENVCLTEF